MRTFKADAGVERAPSASSLRIVRGPMDEEVAGEAARVDETWATLGRLLPHRGIGGTALEFESVLNSYGFSVFPANLLNVAVLSCNRRSHNPANWFSVNH